MPAFPEPFILQPDTSAKLSHTRKKRRKLLKSGIDVDRIRSCLNSNFALYCQSLGHAGREDRENASSRHAPWEQQRRDPFCLFGIAFEDAGCHVRAFLSTREDGFDESPDPG